MKKLLLVSLCFLLLSVAQVFAQNRTVTGTVIAKEDGGPIPGVSVTVKGTTIGVVTGADGKYSIRVPESSSKILVFKFIGYATVEKSAAGSVVNATIEIANKELGEVLVSGALGVKRQAQELGYAATDISAKQITETHPTNFTNGLAAKAPGLVISTLDNGINPNTRFTLRGNRHILGNNYALVLLNGVPISPNDVNTINPDDIESVDILNGAGAAALYGSDASNGALSITTKKGSSNGAPQITYSNTFLAERISYFPGLQASFGSYGGEGGFSDPLTGFINKPVAYENQQYGPQYDGSMQNLGLPVGSNNGPQQVVAYSPNNSRQQFFQTGISDQNNVSYAVGDAANFFNLSANDLARKGVTPGDRYDRNVVRVSAGKTYGMLKLDFTASYSRQLTSTYGAGFDGAGLNGGRTLLSTILNTPAWVPLQNYKDINSTFGNANGYYNSYGVNPYWIVNDSRQNTQQDAFNGSFSATLTPTKWADLTYRLSDNNGTGQYQYTRAEVDFSAYYRSDPFSTGNQSNGYFGGDFNTPGYIPGQVLNITQYGDGSVGGAAVVGGGAIPAVNAVGSGPQGFSRISQDIFMNFHKTFLTDFKANLLLGSSIWQENYQQVSNSSTNLLVNNFYNIGSILGVPNTGQSSGQINQIAWLSALNLSYKDFAFIEVSDRNDRDSRLSAANRSFFYPSVKGSFVATNAISALKDNKYLTYLKLRGSYSKVGDVNVSPYSITNTFSPTSGFPYSNVGGLSLSTTLNNPTLKPEFTKELEFGADASFFDNRINGSVTYYKSNTTNQTLPISVSPATGYNSTLVNVGEVQNTGLETKLDLQVLTKQKNNVGLDLAGNFTIQNSNVVSLVNGSNSVTVGGYTNAVVQAVVGQPYPVIMGTDINRDPQGHPIVSATTGLPSLNSSLVNLGRTTPKYLLGLTQTVSYKFMSLAITSEFRTGNVIYNQGLSQATAAGASNLSASTGRQPFVYPNSVIQTSPGVFVPNTNTLTNDGAYSFWQTSATYTAASTYVTSAAFWKLREADLNFDLSQFAKKTKYIKRANFSLIGRNLLMFRPGSNSWSDPEFGTSGNDQGYSNNQLPPTRFFGASLNLTF